MRIPILSQDFELEHVCDLLRRFGLVIIQSSRPHVQQLEDDARLALEIDDPNDETLEEDDTLTNSLMHLSTPVDDMGWSEYLIYSPTYEYDRETTAELVARAVRAWVAKGYPTQFIASV